MTLHHQQLNTENVAISGLKRKMPFLPFFGDVNKHNLFVDVRRRLTVIDMLLLSGHVINMTEASTAKHDVFQCSHCHCLMATLLMLTVQSTVSCTVPFYYFQQYM